MVHNYLLPQNPLESGTLDIRLHKNKSCGTAEIISHEQLYKKLSTCMIDRIEVKNVGLFTYNMTRPTDEQRELLERLGLKQLIEQKILEKIRSASLI